MFPKETRILVLDDMPSMRQIVKGLLREMGYTNLFDVENGKEGCAALERSLNEEKLPFGLILSDWNMPVMTGIDFLKHVREHPVYKDIPFLLVTAEGEFRQVKQAMSMKVTDYIVKPFTPATMKAKIESCWKKHNSPATPAAPAAPTTPAKT